MHTSLSWQGVGAGLPGAEQVNAEHHIDAGHGKREQSVCIGLAGEGWLHWLRKHGFCPFPEESQFCFHVPSVGCQGPQVQTKEPHKETPGKGV